MGKVASGLDRRPALPRASGTTGSIARRVLAGGDGWTVADIVCTAGPSDRPFEERHDGISVSVVLAGTFQYRSPRGRAMLTPGSLLLGNDGECYECGHEHAVGDRCVAVHFTPDFFEHIAADLGVRSATKPFRAPRVVPHRATARFVARAAAGAAHGVPAAWDELALDLAAAALDAADGERLPPATPSRASVARVTETVRRIEEDFAGEATLARLAADASQSPYHYLRTFRRITGVTPHQFVLRARLRAAAVRLLAGGEKVIDVALAIGFGDLSNFNHAFRREFGVTPRAYRRSGGRR